VIKASDIDLKDVDYALSEDLEFCGVGQVKIREVRDL
jgi:hypothetical protein